MKANIEKLKLIPESEYNRLNERIRQLESILKNIETIHVADTVVKMSSLRGENERLKRSVEHYKKLKTQYKHQMKMNEQSIIRLHQKLNAISNIISNKKDNDKLNKKDAEKNIESSYFTMYKTGGQNK